MNSDWTTIIQPSRSIFSLNLKELLSYRDLLWLFVKRDIVTVYKQTMLGPLWFFIQPLLTTVMFSFVFGKLANISTEGAPHFAFYLVGITVWNYFAVCLTKTSNTFIANQGIFGKVYFPRIIVPVSQVVSNLIKFFIQFILFLAFLFYYWFNGLVSPNLYVVLLPLVILIMATLSLGIGMIFSSLTTKYRDLTFLLGFGIQLWMYGSPVIYSISSVPTSYKSFLQLNPITSLIENMRYAFLGIGSPDLTGILYSFIFSIVVFSLGFLIFNKVEKNFMDIV